MEKELKFCYEKTFVAAKSYSFESRAVAYKEKYWNKGHDLKIFFMGGTDAQKAEMRMAIIKMLGSLSLTATFVDTADESEIRISFKYGYGSYSYLGTDALFISKENETLNIGWDGRDVMYHELGHVLNLAHEHQNPRNGIVWNEAQVIADLSGEPNNWPIEVIRRNVLDKISAELVDANDFDPHSIMLYYIPNSWTIGDFSSNHNSMPSIDDMYFLREKYNYTVEDTVAPVITLNGDDNAVLGYGETYVELGATASDNRDGDLTPMIRIEGTVDSTYTGIHFIKYTVSDSAGNVAVKTRNVLVNAESTIGTGTATELYRELFSTKYRLGKLVEPQLVIMAGRLGIDASVNDLKSDTIDKVWDAIS